MSLPYESSNMKNKLFVILLIIVSGFLAQQVRADGVLLSWSERDVQGVTEEAFNEAKLLTAEQITRRNLAVHSWADAFLLMVAATPRKDEKPLLAGLVAQLTNQSKSVLQGTGRLIIWERITSGEMLFEGKGYQVDDDLFTVAGRANWMLRNLTKKNFGYVRLRTSGDELTKLQQKWTGFLAGGQVEEFKNPYETTEKGLGEIRSRDALEALIVVLKPTEAKDKLTRDCLQRIYKMDKLPTDPDSPALMCSPDPLTHGYLAVITDVKDKHDYEWWKSWWQQNQGKLQWQREQGKFVVKN
jgi:hypothetical protein